MKSIVLGRTSVRLRIWQSVCRRKGLSDAQRENATTATLTKHEAQRELRKAVEDMYVGGDQRKNEDEVVSTCNNSGSRDPSQEACAQQSGQ